MLGQGVVPNDYHPIADGLSESQLREKMANTLRLKKEPLPKMPEHDRFLQMFCGSA